MDPWHLGKLRIPAGEPRRIPPQFLAWIELSDGQLANMPDLSDESLNHRGLPGEGELGVGRCVAAAQASGYHGPWGVEVLPAELRGLLMREMYQRAHAATAAEFSPAHGGAEGSAQRNGG